MTVIKGAATELGTERIRKLLVQYSVPAIIAMTASSLYNMVDSIFIGLGVGPMAISGLALTFPLMNLAAAFGSLVGVGAATLISMRLGQKDYASAQYILGNVVVLNFIIGLGFGLVTLLFLDPILYFFGASEATIGYARDYMSIILMGNVVTHMYLGLNSVLRSAGHPRKSMYATINTVVINTILDPLFIYGFGWGIRGAAIATVLAQVISLVWQFRLLSDSSELLHFHRGIYRPRKRIVKEILAIGMSPFLMNVTACFIVILINKGLKEHGGDLMIGAYGIVNRLAFFFVMIVMGLNQGMQPIAGYIFGARQYDRLMHVLKLTVIGATCVTSLGFLLGELLPHWAVAVFTTDEELIRLAAEGMRIVFLCFPIIGFQMVTTNFFQSIGMAPKAVGERLAERFGIPVYDKRLIKMAAEHSGFGQEFFEKADEKPAKGFFATLLGYLRSPFAGDDAIYNNPLSHDALFKMQSDVIRQLAERESCIFVGRCADYILREHPRCVNIFVSASREDRIERLVRTRRLTPEAAEQLMDSTDEKRADYYNYYSNRTWGAAATYHLCIDSSVLGIDGTAAFAEEFIRKKLNLARKD